LAVTIQPHHQALWQKAAAHTVPEKTNRPPTYGAWHRQRAERRIAVPVEPEPETPAFVDEARGTE